MRYHEIAEAWKMAPHEYDVEEITEVLIRDCGPYLNEIDGQVQNYKLWRGIKGNLAKGFGKKTARLTGRKPMNTKASQHEMINKFFVDNFEHPFRDGVFATGNIRQAKEYSHRAEWPYIIFPIGNFDYLWHPWVADLYDTVATVAPVNTNDMLEKLKPGFRQDGIKDAIATMGGREVMLWCEEYYYIEHKMMAQLPQFLQ